MGHASPRSSRVVRDLLPDLDKQGSDDDNMDEQSSEEEAPADGQYDSSSDHEPEEVSAASCCDHCVNLKRSCESLFLYLGSISVLVYFWFKLTTLRVAKWL